jgi:RNA polymerase sigma factor (sigma-70 family)
MGARRSVDEEALMQAYAEGDADAFQQLFDSLSPPLQGFFRRSVQDASVAEDLVQTTFLKLHVARRRWRRGERLRPWVFAIAAHIRVDWYRSRGRREPDESVEEDAAQDAAGDDPSVELGRVEAGLREPAQQVSDGLVVDLPMEALDELQVVRAVLELLAPPRGRNLEREGSARLPLVSALQRCGIPPAVEHLLVKCLAP